MTKMFVKQHLALPWSVRKIMYILQLIFIKILIKKIYMICVIPHFLLSIYFGVGPPSSFRVFQFPVSSCGSFKSSLHTPALTKLSVTSLHCIAHTLSLSPIHFISSQVALAPLAE